MPVIAANKASQKDKNRRFALVFVPLLVALASV